MKYYVVADVHGFYTELITALTEKGFFEDKGPHKLIVCGDWHCSYGHAKVEGKGTERGANADYSPYYGKGIIALDACTVLSKKVNCIVIKD